METLSALLAFCAGNSPVTGEFPAQRPVTRSVDVFFDLLLNKRLSKQSWGLWFETPLCSLWHHCNEVYSSHAVGYEWSPYQLIFSPVSPLQWAVLYRMDHHSGVSFLPSLFLCFHISILKDLNKQPLNSLLSISDTCKSNGLFDVFSQVYWVNKHVGDISSLKYGPVDCGLSKHWPCMGPVVIYHTNISK